jgi:hypothetical protein
MLKQSSLLAFATLAFITASPIASTTAVAGEKYIPVQGCVTDWRTVRECRKPKNRWDPKCQCSFGDGARDAPAVYVPEPKHCYGKDKYKKHHRDAYKRNEWSKGKHRSMGPRQSRPLRQG